MKEDNVLVLFLLFFSKLKVEAFRLQMRRRAPGPELAGNWEQNAQLL